MESCGKPVAVAANEVRKVRNRPRIQNTEAVRASAVRWNDIARKAAIRVVVARGNDLAALPSQGRLRIPDQHGHLIAARFRARDERIIRIKQLAEIALAHL